MLETVKLLLITGANLDDLCANSKKAIDQAREWIKRQNFPAIVKLLEDEPQRRIDAKNHRLEIINQLKVSLPAVLANLTTAYLRSELREFSYIKVLPII